MGDTIKFKKGLKENLPTLGIGEPGFTTNVDDQRMYIGGPNGNVAMPKMEEVNQINKTLNVLSNPNLLINGDFQVWQRGTFFGGYYTDVSGVPTKLYTADRWCYDVEGSDKGDVHKYEDGGLCFKLMSDKRFWFIQHIELTKELIYSIRQNGYLTLSFDIFSNVILDPKARLFGGTISYPNSPTLEKSYTCDSTNRRVSITFKITPDFINGQTSLALDIFRLDDTNKKVIDGDKFVVIRNVKLEIGDVATPFNPRPYVEELAMCKRYFQRVLYSGRLDFIGVNNVQKLSNLEVPMRVNIPTITTNATIDTLLIATLDGTNQNSGWEVSFLINQANVITLDALKIEHGITDGYIRGNSFSAFADAEIY